MSKTNNSGANPQDQDSQKNKSKKTSTEKTEREHKPGWKKYEREMFKFQYPLVYKFVYANAEERMADCMAIKEKSFDQSTEALDKIREEHKKIFLRDTIEEVLISVEEWLIERLIEMGLEIGLEKYFEREMIVKKIDKDFTYWLGQYQKVKPYLKLNAEREERADAKAAEVQALSKQGWSNEQIGDKLGFCERSVRRHLKRQISPIQAAEQPGQTTETKEPTKEATKEITETKKLTETETMSLPNVPKSKTPSSLKSKTPPTTPATRTRGFQKPQENGLDLKTKKPEQQKEEKVALAHAQEKEIIWVTSEGAINADSTQWLIEQVEKKGKLCEVKVRHKDALVEIRAKDLADCGTDEIVRQASTATKFGQKYVYVLDSGERLSD